MATMTVHAAGPFTVHYGKAAGGWFDIGRDTDTVAWFVTPEEVEALAGEIMMAAAKLRRELALDALAAVEEEVNDGELL